MLWGKSDSLCSSAMQMMLQGSSGVDNTQDSAQQQRQHVCTDTTGRSRIASPATSDCGTALHRDNIQDVQCSTFHSITFQLPVLELLPSISGIP